MFRDHIFLSFWLNCCWLEAFLRLRLELFWLWLFLYILLFKQTWFLAQTFANVWLEKFILTRLWRRRMMCPPRQPGADWHQNQLRAAFILRQQSGVSIAIWSESYAAYAGGIWWCRWRASPPVSTYVPYLPDGCCCNIYIWTIFSKQA